MSVLTLFTITTACSLCDSFHMDFGHLGFDNFLCSTSALENTAEISKQKCYGFGFQRQERAVNEGHQQMLCFSHQPVNLPYYPHTASPFGIVGRAPFTESQWMELEHQALIYKYITANVPIPGYLLNPIRKAFESAGFPALRSNSLGWGGFQLGFSSTDPEPGRCRRTDGKKWRCSRDAVAEQKYCDRHMNRGRHRSRKPVEPKPPNTTAATTLLPSHLHPTPASAIPRSVEDANGGYQHTTLVSITSPKAGVKNKHRNSLQESSSSFGLVNSDSLLNPFNNSSSLINCPPSNNNKSLRHFIDDWPKTRLSISIPTSDWELNVGRIPEDQNSRKSWEPSMGGPLGEVLHNSAGECNLSPCLATSPTGVLQRGAFGSLSNSSTASSPRAETLVMNAPLPAPLI